MEVIIPGNDIILGILGKPKGTNEPLRMRDYCRTLPVEEGVLLHNVLTRELLLLTAGEYDNVLSNPYLREQWFTVPAGTADGELEELLLQEYEVGIEQARTDVERFLARLRENGLLEEE